MIAENDTRHKELLLRRDTGHDAADEAVALPATWYATCKRVADFLLALVLLVLTAPVIFVAALLTKLASRGPAFYLQTRLGLHGHPYTIYKIRTMIHDCESLTGPRWATPNDPRITPLGRFLRRIHVDELPQLWNVLRGEMSLVGPRPERPEFVHGLQRVFPYYRDRLLVRPGVTGLAQVQLPADTDLASVRRKLAYDLYYVRRLGLGLDLKILFCTVLYVLGVPCPVLGKLLLLPNRKAIEAAKPSQSNLSAEIPALSQNLGGT